VSTSLRSELYVDLCLKDLSDEYVQCHYIGLDFVAYRQMVNATSSRTCLGKSPNKHNRVYLAAEPMSDEICKDIEDGKLGPKAEVKEQVRILRETYDWDDNAVRKT